MASFIFKCFDMDLVSEYCSTCGEYMGYVFRPFSHVKPSQLLKCSQPSWDQAFKEWTVLELYFGVLVALVVAILYLVEGDFHSIAVAEAMQFAVTGIIQAYFAAHLAWFGGSKKHGCCWCCCCCFEGYLVLLLWTLLLILAVVNQAWTAIGEATFAVDYEYPLFFIISVLRLLYVVILSYQAVCLFRMYQENESRSRSAAGSEVPKTINVIVGQPVEQPAAQAEAPKTAAEQPVGQENV